MRLPGRLAAAIEVLEQIMDRHRPARDALQDWARSHRFAGSSDRAVIGNLVFDALRRRASLGFLMNEDRPRALALAVLRYGWELPAEEIAAVVAEQYGPGPLTSDEAEHLAGAALTEAPAWVRADVPEWLAAELGEAFGDRFVEEGRALATRAPVDLRVNTLKTRPEKLQKALARHNPRQGPFSTTCLRLPPPASDRRQPAVEAEPSHARGWFEVQDAASQVAAFLCGARPGMQVLDYCAGAGGKTLALAAAMENRGQIFAHDSSAARLRPIIARLSRAGVRNAQVVPAGETARLAAMQGTMDLVVVDAPCSGSGSWRRKPDAKWRLKPESLARRIEEQATILDAASHMVKPGGTLAYITCSVLPSENREQVTGFLQRDTTFELMPVVQNWRAPLQGEMPATAVSADSMLQLTPASHGTDGFFIALMSRKAA